MVFTMTLATTSESPGRAIANCKTKNINQGSLCSRQKINHYIQVLYRVQNQFSCSMQSSFICNMQEFHSPSKLSLNDGHHPVGSRVSMLRFKMYITCDPPLKARNPKMRMNPPRAAKGTEWPGMSLGLPLASKRPCRGPMTAVAMAAVKPLSIWTAALPAKSCKIRLLSIFGHVHHFTGCCSRYEYYSINSIQYTTMYNFELTRDYTCAEQSVPDIPFEEAIQIHPKPSGLPPDTPNLNK